jgi:hypothetical protein
MVITLVIGAVLEGASLAGSRRYSELDDNTYRALVDLHAIRRRIDVARFKADLRRDAAHHRRALRRELEDLDRQDRGRP